MRERRDQNPGPNPGRAADEHPMGFPLGRREMIAVAAFWTAFGILLSLNLLVPPAGGPPSRSPLSVLAVIFAESYAWALLTPPIFILATRYSVERGSRLARLWLFLAFGVVTSLLVDVGLGVLRSRAPLSSSGGPGPGRGAPPLWVSARLHFVNAFTIYLAVLAAGIARDYFLRYHARRAEAVQLQAHAAQLQAQLAESRLEVLRAQLNPHFLFNTLHAVSALVERDPKGVRRTIARSSELLRSTLDGSTEQEIPLARELALLRRYLDILEIRFQGRLTTTIEDAADTRDALVPNLVLQPLVENAMKHGVNLAEGASRIDVRAWREGDMLVLSVHDSGAGAPSAGAMSSSRLPGNASANGNGASPGGLGLRNTRARLEGLYGTHQRLWLEPAAEGGMVATVAIPFHTAADLHTMAVATPSATSP